PHRGGQLAGQRVEVLEGGLGGDPIGLEPCGEIVHLALRVGAEVREPRRRAPCARRHLLLVLPCEHLRDAPAGVPQRLQLPPPRRPPVAEAVQQIGGGDDLVVGIVQGGDDALDVPCEPALGGGQPPAPAAPPRRGQ